MTMLCRERRMFLIQVAAGEDTPASAVHRCRLWPLICPLDLSSIFLLRSPGAGMVLSGTNTTQPADLDTRHTS